MECSLVHIVPFDIGISFSNYEDTKRYSKNQFLNDLKEAFPDFYINENDAEYLCKFKISEKIECRLFAYGIGVFIVRNLAEAHNEKAVEFFTQNAACITYYKKKAEQHEILYWKDTPCLEIKPIFDTMCNIWNIKNGLKKVGTRPYSSNTTYKHHGLSYVLTIYHIVDKCITVKENKEFDLLMNPAILGEILNENSWEDIKVKIQSYHPIGYEKTEYNEKTAVIASWSAVAVVEEINTKIIDSIIRYEASLQSAWFLFDALTDNLESINLSDLELQRSKSTATNVFLDTSNILSANMSTNEKGAMEIIYKTSGLETEKNKCFLLLENRIAIEKSKQSNRQTIYGIITEILLVAFTLIQIYQPIEDFISGEITHTDIIVATIMLITLIVSSIFIIRREK